MSPEEILHLLQVLHSHPHKDTDLQMSMVLKLNKPILEALEREEDRLKDRAYFTWSRKEAQKIENLKKEYVDLQARKIAVRRKQNLGGE